MTRKSIGGLLMAVAVLLLASLTVYAAGSWASLASLPDPDGAGPANGRTEGMAVGGVDGMIIAAYGFDGGAGDSRFTRLYNIASDAWSTGALAPSPVRSEVAYGDTTHGGKFYAIGGRSGGGVLNNLERYDRINDTWATLAPMSTARAAAVAVTVGNAIYVIGGRTGTAPLSGTPLAVVERYDINTNTWATVASIKSGPRSDFAGVAHGGKIYIFGGWDGTNTIDLVDRYDPMKDTWISLRAMLFPRAVHMAGTIGNRVYVFGGADSAGAVSGTNQVYDIAKDTWGTDASMPAGKAVGETGVYSHGGRLYVVDGAQPAFGTPTNFTQVFKP